MAASGLLFVINQAILVLQLFLGLDASNLPTAALTLSVCVTWLIVNFWTLNEIYKIQSK